MEPKEKSVQNLRTFTVYAFGSESIYVHNLGQFFDPQSVYELHYEDNGRIEGTNILISHL